jgi:non-ribosomal peptide synthetase component E (peptide arylation enzyme)
MISRRRIPALAALVTAAYFLLAIGAVRSFALGLPGWLETALSVLAAPAVVLLLAWNSVLAPLGMTTGEAVVVPTLLPCLAIVALYAAAVWVVARVLVRPH